MEQIRNLMGRIDALSIRERGIIFAGIVLVLFSVWDSVLMQPQLIQEKKLLSDLQIKHAEQSALNVKFQGQLKQQQTDPDKINREKLAELKTRLEQIESEVKQSTSHLISPRDMARILETILNKSGGLRLTEIKGLGASPLLATESETVATDTAAKPETITDNAVKKKDGSGLDNAYKHGLFIKLEGNYMSTLEYLKTLESLPWGFFWEKLDYEVMDYPTASISITLYTLSLEQDWIGV